MKEDLEGQVTPLAERIANALERVAAGEPLHGVLSETESDAEVSACVQLAVDLGHLLPQEPRPVFRAALQVRLQSTGQVPPQAWYRSLFGGESRRGRFVSRLAGAGLAVVLVFASAAAASADALPGEALYRVKRVSEEARGLLIRDREDRMEWRLDLADERLREIRALLDRGESVDADLLDAVAIQQDLAREAALAGSPSSQEDVRAWSETRAALLMEWAGQDTSADAVVLRRAAGALLGGAIAQPAQSTNPGLQPIPAATSTATLTSTPALTAVAGFSATPTATPTDVTRSGSGTPTVQSPGAVAPLATATSIASHPTEPAVGDPPPVVELTPGSGGSSDMRPGRETDVARRTQEAQPTPDDGSSGDSREPTQDGREPTEDAREPTP